MVMYGGLTISKTELCSSSQIFKEDPLYVY